MLTTVDNPFNPYTHYDAWLAYDLWLGHGTNAYLARVVITSDELSQADYDADIESAIDEILLNDESNLYVRAVDPNAAG
jgi:hypothetical protein